jgi:hypothetical protein
MREESKDPRIGSSRAPYLTCDKSTRLPMSLRFMQCIEPHISTPGLYQPAPFAPSVARGCGCGSSRVLGYSGRPLHSWLWAAQSPKPRQSKDDPVQSVLIPEAVMVLVLSESIAWVWSEYNVRSASCR